MYTTTMNCKVEENPYLCVEEEQLKILKGRCAANVNMKQGEYTISRIYSQHVDKNKVPVDIT